ncbi:hypothetical protein, partial [Helicobacter trogontum]|uniref:hypothetical protein n=1 Tax=Helicobacter trogontum TaxID=50960 RepID=UPI001319CC07
EKFRGLFLWEIEGVENATDNEKNEAITRLVNGWGANNQTIANRLANFNMLEREEIFNDAFY